MPVKLKQSQALGMLNMTPIIDIVFNLLIFFLVAAEFAQEDEAALPVELPNATEAKPLIQRPKMITIGIDQEGNYGVSGTRMTLPELEAHLRRAMIDNPLGQSAVIRGDRSVEYRHVIAVKDACLRVGVPYTESANPNPE
jgi:biopolymer transport protein ExbD